jgi:hypothetical protein
MSVDADPGDPDFSIKITKFVLSLISFPIACGGPVFSEIDKCFEIN